MRDADERGDREGPGLDRPPQYVIFYALKGSTHQITVSGTEKRQMLGIIERIGGRVLRVTGREKPWHR